MTTKPRSRTKTIVRWVNLFEEREVNSLFYKSRSDAKAASYNCIQVRVTITLPAPKKRRGL